MKYIIHILMVGIALFITNPAQAIDVIPMNVGELTITEYWARASVGKNSAAYMNIENTGDTADTLIGATAKISHSVELHNHVEENGILKMREVESVEIPHKSITHLAPGGLHIMFMGLHEPLAENTTLQLQLKFAKAGDITLEIPVVKYVKP